VTPSGAAGYTPEMRVVVDDELCESNALCMGVAPEVFELRDDDLLYVLGPPRPSLLPERTEEV
jgi:ferredoxin